MNTETNIESEGKIFPNEEQEEICMRIMEELMEIIPKHVFANKDKFDSQSAFDAFLTCTVMFVRENAYILTQQGEFPDNESKKSFIDEFLKMLKEEILGRIMR